MILKTQDDRIDGSLGLKSLNLAADNGPYVLKTRGIWDLIDSPLMSPR